MFRFLHTADWQLGMMACGLGEVARQVRAARLEALRRVFHVAIEHRAQAVLVAGDLFEDNHVENRLVEEVLAVLNEQAAIPVYIIPGNHDPLSRDSVYLRPAWKQLRPHVHLCATCDPVPLAEGVMLLPCPLKAKKGTADPTAAIPARDGAAGSVAAGGGAVIRIGLAHGSLPFRDDIGYDDYPIALDAAARKGLDYLALGHWHSTWPDPAQDSAARAFYSGAHEPTKFGEGDSGNVLAVTLEAPGQPPRIEKVRTGILNWREQNIDVAVEDLAGLTRRLREEPDAGHTLLRLTLHGLARPEHAQQLAELRDLLGARYLYHEIDDAAVGWALDDAALSQLLRARHLQEAARQLQAQASGAANPEVARRALEILQQVAWQNRPADP